MTTHISNHSLNNEECVCVLSRLPSLSTVSVETLYLDQHWNIQRGCHHL